MEFYKSTRNRDVLYYQGFEYLLHRTISGVNTWRCRLGRSIKCKSIMKINESGEIIQPPNDHCHESSPQKATLNKVISKMKDEVKTQRTTPRLLVNEMMSTLDSDVLAHLPKKESLERCLFNKSKLLIPKDSSFKIPTLYKDLVLHDTGADDPNRILVLGYLDLALEFSQDVVYGDGNFDKVPRMIFQLYTWHAKIGNSYPPLIYFLMKKKTQQTFDQMFEILKALFPDMTPTLLLMDLKKKEITSAKKAFPTAKVKGCYKHLLQHISDVVKSVGLQQMYDTDINTKLIMKSLAALAFVPRQDVKSAFKLLAKEFPDEDAYNEVLTYFFSNFIEGAAGRDPKYPFKTWNHYDDVIDMSPMVTNSVNQHHDKLNSIFKSNYANILILIDGIAKDINVHKKLLEDVQKAGPLRQSKMIKIHEKIALIVQQYDEEWSNRKVEYLRILANLA